MKNYVNESRSGMIVRLLRKGEEELCNAFHNRMYGANRTIDQWRWGFVPSLFPCDTIPYAVVEDKAQIVGTQALIPIRMIDRQGVFWTAKSEGTILDPAYRGKELFDAMYGLMFEFAEKHRMPYIWGFTQAEKPLTRIGFQIPAKTTQLFFPFSRRAEFNIASGPPSSLAAHAKAAGYRLGLAAASSFSSLRLALASQRSSRNRKSGALRIRTLTEPPPDAGSLCKEFIRQQGGKTIFRDADYLRWRLFSNPYFKSLFRAVYDGDHLIGWVAFSISDTGMSYLVDLMAIDSSRKGLRVEEVTRVLLGEAVLGARNLGAVAIPGWQFNDHPFDRNLLAAAKSLGFYHIRKGHAMVICPLEAAREAGFDQTFSDWYVNRIFTEGVLG